MNHKYIVNEDADRGNVYFDRGKASSQCQKRQKYFLLSVPDDRRVYYQLTEEDIILYDQAEKLLYTDMKQLIPTSADGKEEQL